MCPRPASAATTFPTSPSQLPRKPTSSTFIRGCRIFWQSDSNRATSRQASRVPAHFILITVVVTAAIKQEPSPLPAPSTEQSANQPKSPQDLLPSQGAPVAEVPGRKDAPLTIRPSTTPYPTRHNSLFNTLILKTC